MFKKLDSLVVLSFHTSLGRRILLTLRVLMFGPDLLFRAFRPK
jgi:hypothetical protein